MLLGSQGIQKKVPLLFGFVAGIEKYIVVFPCNSTWYLTWEYIWILQQEKKVQMNRSLVSFMSTRSSKYSPWELELKSLINPPQVIPDTRRWTGITVLWIYSCLQSMVRWSHWLSGHEFEQSLGDSEGQGSFMCCSSWGLKELNMT